MDITVNSAVIFIVNGFKSDGFDGESMSKNSRYHVNFNEKIFWSISLIDHSRTAL